MPRKTSRFTADSNRMLGECGKLFVGNTLAILKTKRRIHALKCKICTRNLDIKIGGVQVRNDYDPPGVYTTYNTKKS